MSKLIKTLTIMLSLTICGSITAAAQLSNPSDDDNNCSTGTCCTSTPETATSTPSIITTDYLDNNEGFRYEINEEGNASILLYYGADGNVEVPSEIDGKIVTEIEPGAFADCKTVKSVIIPEGVKSIGFNAFWRCTNLQNIKLPNTLEEIGYTAFYGCENLKSINIPSKVEEITSSTFGECTNLSEVTLPDNLLSIDCCAFSNCNIKDIKIPNSVTEIQEWAFSTNPLESVVLPDNLENIGHTPFAQCNSLSEVKLSSQNKKFNLVDGVLLTKDNKSLVSILRNHDIFSILSSVTSIKDQGYYGCEKIKELIIPKDLNISYSELKNLLNSCYIDKITVEEENETFSSNNGTLYSKDKTNLLFVPEGQNSDKFEIISTIKSIDKNALDRCNAKELVIPKGFSYVFDDFCIFRNLQNITVDSENETYSSQDGVLYNKDKSKLIYIPYGVKDNTILSDNVKEMSVSPFSPAYEGKSVLVSKKVYENIKDYLKDESGYPICSITENAEYYKLEWQNVVPDICDEEPPTASLPKSAGGDSPTGDNSNVAILLSSLFVAASATFGIKKKIN